MFRSERSIVIAPANTGIDSKRRIAVMRTDHTNKGVSFQDIVETRILIMDVMKLIAPKIEEIPARWRLKIVKSTEGPG